MSGITPIIDTVLHQVLGRSSSVSLLPVAERPVAPPPLTERPLAPQSDSRLDPRALLDVRAKTSSGQVGAKGAATLSPPPADSIAANTHLSGSARAIANILSLFPSSPSAITPATPLISNASELSLLAASLRASVETSGLFYESHLLHWLKGRLPLEQLQQQPQMQQAANTSVDASTKTSLINQLSAAAGEIVKPGLEGLVRHQLEMLTQPILQWQGAPWVGAFLNWILIPPSDHHEGEGAEDESQSEGNDEAVWRSSMKLDVRGFGEIKANIQLGDSFLFLAFSAEQQLVSLMQPHIDRLQQRLDALDIGKVDLVLQVQHLAEEGDSG